MYDKLVGEKVVLRKARLDDLELMYDRVWSDARVAKYMLWEVNESLEEAKDRLKRTIEYHKDHYAYFITLKDIDEPIGFVGFKEIESGVFEDTGAALGCDFHGKRYAKEAVALLLNLMFNELGAHKVILSCFNVNEASRRLILSLGFTYFKDGKIIREHDNQEFDIEFYCLNKEDYKKELK